jgi:ribosome production factor 1
LLIFEEEEKKKVTKTLDNTREFDETIVAPNDEEVLKDEQVDEFAEYFQGDKVPSILITTCISPTQVREH